MYLLSGSADGIRRWQVVDGQEGGSHTGMDLSYGSGVLAPLLKMRRMDPGDSI